jgi:hypothetical protein
VVESLLAWAVLPTLGWRALLIFSTLPVVLIMSLYWWLPESPRFLVVAGREDEALAQLRVAAQANGKSLPDDYHLDKVIFEAKDQGAVKQLFSKELRFTTLCISVLWFTDVFVYYGVVVITPTYFAQKGQSIYAASLFGAAAELPGLLLGLWLINRVGRKRTISYLLAITVVASFGLTGTELPSALLTLFAMLARGSINGAFGTSFVYTAVSRQWTIFDVLICSFPM